MDGAAKFKVSPTTKPRNNASKIAFVCFNKIPPYFCEIIFYINCTEKIPILTMFSEYFV
ncbi:hypothetical protein BAN44_1323 [Bacillus anthracis]|nr:hypothetical protein BAN44_1323 [Bacillus anthracis]GAO64094.1 hypothetical protein BA5240_1344 [Bacillus anthracis]